MRFKTTASASPANESGARKFIVHISQEFYQPLVQKLNWANMSTAMKRNLKIAGIVVAGVLVFLIALPLFINVNSFRPKIESEATNALGRPVTLGSLSLSILSGSVGVDNISIADDPSFSKSPFVTAKSLSVGVKLMPLIFSRELNVTEIVLDEPQITLLKATNGKWNFSSLGGTNAKGSPQPEQSGTAASQNFSVAKLEIKDGKLNIGKANSTAKPQVYDSVNVEVRDFSFASQFPFELTTALPGTGKANISGKAGPMNQQDAANTPVDVEIKVDNLDLAASGFFDQTSGLSGLVNFTGSLVSDGSQAKAAGTLNCDKLKLSPKGSPAPKLVTIKYAVNADLNKQAGTPFSAIEKRG